MHIDVIPLTDQFYALNPCEIFKYVIDAFYGLVYVSIVIKFTACSVQSLLSTILGGKEVRDTEEGLCAAFLIRE